MTGNTAGFLARHSPEVCERTCRSPINRLPTLVPLTISARPGTVAIAPVGAQFGAGKAQDGSLIGRGAADRMLG